MALSVSTDLVVITNAENSESASWSDVGGGAGSGQETDFAIQGSECRSRAVSGASASRGMIFDNGANLDFTTTHADKLIYFWIATFSPGLVDNVATAPGLRIRIDTAVTPGTAFWEWDIMYSDLLASEGTEFFRVYVLDPRAPATRAGGSPSLTTLRHFGAVLDTNATAKGQNLAIDKITFGFGEIIVDGTATDASSGLEEMVAFDWETSANVYGILTRNEAGSISCKGKLVIGDDVGTNATAFTAQDTTITWAPTFYYDGTRIRPTVGYDSSNNWIGRKSDGTAYYGIDLRGNGTGDTDVTFGAAVGSAQGRSGPTFIGSDQIPTEFTGDDGAVENVALYGVTFDNFRKIDLSSNASTDIMRSCTLKNCGPLDIGPVAGRNNTFINGIGGGYEFLERFTNREASGAEDLATADPITEWTALLNGTQLSVPSATAEYVELLNGDNNSHVVILDDDKMGSNNHYVDAILRYPSAGAAQGTIGVVINCASGTEDYYYFQIDLVNDQVSLIEVNTGTDTTLVGPTAFTMDEDEDYVIHLRSDGTNVEAFITGNSVADGRHSVKLAAVEATHTTNRRVGVRGDASTSQTGDAPRIRLFGAGPITDNLGSIIMPDTAALDFETASFINCARALSFDSEGSGDTYSLTALTLSNNLVDAHNDSGGLVTGNITDGTLPSTVENVGASTSSFVASVVVTITVVDENQAAIENAAVYVQLAAGPFNDTDDIVRELTNASGVASDSFTGSTPVSATVRVRQKGFISVNQTQTISSSGLTLTVTMATDTNIE